MVVKARRGTPAMLAEGRPQPPRVFTTEQQLWRLRNGLFVALDGGFGLSESVDLICNPLALRIAAVDSPGRFLRRQSTPPTSHLTNYPTGEAPGVEEVADAIHALIHVVAGVVAEREAERRTAHLHGADRDRAIRHVADLTPRPALPQITRDDLAPGGWPMLLTALAAPYDAPLAEVLGSARTTDPSDRIMEALREADRVAASLRRRLDRAEAVQADRSAPATRRTTTPEAASKTDDERRAELAALGVQI